MIKTAIIGYGFSAQTFHIPFIEVSDKLVLTAISSSQTDRVTERFPTADIYPTAAQLIQESDAELVIITAPNEVHFELAKACLKNNKHVIVEKPFVTTYQQGLELCELADAKKLKLSVYQNRRWDGDFLTLQQLISDGSLGDIRYFESHFDRFRPEVRQRWREQPGAGGGIWFDLGPHLLDQALCLFGMPNSVTARCLELRDQSLVTDYFHVQLHYDQCEVILQGSPFSAGPNIRFQLQGNKGSYVKFGLDPQEDRLKEGLLPASISWSQETSENYGTLYSETDSKLIKTKAGGYQHYFSQMADAILTGSAVPVDPRDALKVIYLIELAEKSSREGNTLAVRR